MRELDELRRAGGAAGVDVGGDVVRRDIAREQQTVGRLLRNQRVEVGIRKRGAARALHGENAHRRRNLVPDRLDVFPDFKAGRRPQRDDDLGFGRVNQFDQLLRLEHPVDAAGNAGFDGAEHGDVKLRQRRQHEQNDIVGRDAERMKQVGGLARLRPQLAVAQANRIAVGIAVGDRTDRDFFRIERAALRNPVVQIPGEYVLRQRNALQLLHIA